MIRLWIAALVAVLVPVSILGAQTAPLEQVEVAYDLDSGPVTNDGQQRQVIFQELITVPDVQWLRLRFDQAKLGEAPLGGEPTILRITSLKDNAIQTMEAVHLGQWSLTTAYFNGSALLIEIIADPGAAPSRLVMSSLLSSPEDAEPGPHPITICGADDDRELSDDPRMGRIAPVGCTGWMFNDANHCFLTAGHCTGSAEVVQFNVPLSNSDGSWNHPGPEDQYAVDPESVQSNGGQGVGDDWAYFGVFPNSTTGLTPFEAQGESFTLATPPPVKDQLIRITGYGSTSSPVPNQWNSVQKTHAGPYVTFDGTLVQYQTDTTGGNSGSPVIDDTTGFAIGIHTHGGCGQGGGANSGTAIIHPDLQDALANPQGVCAAFPLAFDFPDGLPDLVAPDGSTSFTVIVTGDNDGSPESGTGQLHYSTGENFNSVPMIEGPDNVYTAQLPSLPCQEIVSFYVSAESQGGEVVSFPFAAPNVAFDAIVAFDEVIAFSDDFQSDTGWLVTGNASAGHWERGVPVGGGDRGDPPVDADGSGQCYLTGNQDGDSDVDNGSTILTSPLLDASDGATLLQYYTWFDNTFGSSPEQDTMQVHVSDDHGVTWQLLEVIGPSGPEVHGGWNLKQFNLADLPDLDLNSQLLVRFTASDTDPQSVVEAGVDGVKLVGLICGEQACEADLAGDDGVVNSADLLMLLGGWGSDGPGASLAEPFDVISAPDLLVLLQAWGNCSP